MEFQCKDLHVRHYLNCHGCPIQHQTWLPVMTCISLYAFQWSSDTMLRLLFCMLLPGHCPCCCCCCPAVECSHSAELNPAAAANWRPARAGRLNRPSNSLISTAVQPASPRHPHQPVSPKLDRANSVVSHTAATRPHGRAGTPASMYGPAAAAGFLLPGRARHNSPARHLAGDQVRLRHGLLSQEWSMQAAAPTLML